MKKVVISVVAIVVLIGLINLRKIVTARREVTGAKAVLANFVEQVNEGNYDTALQYADPSFTATSGSSDLSVLRSDLRDISKPDAIQLLSLHGEGSPMVWSARFRLPKHSADESVAWVCELRKLSSNWVVHGCERR